MLKMLALLFISLIPASVGASESIWTDWKASRPRPLNALAKNFVFSRKEGAPKVKLLFFWASWCDVCKAAQVEIDRWAKLYSPTELEILSVSLEDDGEAARQRAAEITQGSRYPIWYAGPALHASLKVPIFPSLFLLDGNTNRVLTVYSGFTKSISSELLKRIRQEVGK